MRFLVITHAPHKELKGDFFGYGPYVREMNIWFDLVSEVRIVAPLIPYTEDPIDEKLVGKKKISFSSVPNFNTLTWPNKLRSIFVVPYCFFTCIKAMVWAEHIHIRCPGNMGLIGLMAQFFFPRKVKTVKYAGNWDDYEREHTSYKVQKYLSRNTFFSQNTKVLVYGTWENFTDNCIPFFTASYTEVAFQTQPLQKSVTDNALKFVFAGTLDERKRPDLTIEVIHLLASSGISNIQLTILGTGPYLQLCEELIVKYDLAGKVFIRGNVSSKEIVRYYNESHFLIFLSRMEGWPKVVAEAMSWGCVPITTPISCVPWMLGNQTRGRIVSQDPASVALEITKIILGEIKFETLFSNAISWSRQFTLEKFKSEISKLL